MSLDDYDRAILGYTKAIELKPNFAEAYLWRGYSYAITGDYVKASADREKAIELKPKLAFTMGR